MACLGVLTGGCEPYTPAPATGAAAQPAKCGYHPICLKGDLSCTIDANGCELCTCNLNPGQ
jgi:hypothetical protein